MKTYIIFDDGYVEKIFLNKKTAIIEYDKLISLEKERYENEYKKPYEKRGYPSSIRFDTIETED